MRVVYGGVSRPRSGALVHLTNTPSEVTWACDVTTIERKGDFTLLDMTSCATAFGRGCQAIMQTAGGTNYPA